MPTLARHTSLPRPPARPFRWIDAAFRTHAQRDRLAQLEPHLRDDIGLTDGQIESETRRPFWDVPNWWR